MAEEIKSTWLIKQNGIINTNVDKDLKLVTEDSPVAVVSVIGGQSSGKSTFCNCLFGTDFKEMDAEMGRFKTTKGNWVAKKPLPEGCLLLIDTEGRDGSEHKDDNKFQKQTALFALAVSDIIVVNMWCSDIGRYEAAGWPLLMTVFEVMMRICDQRRATLLFVLRDKTPTPLERLKNQIMDELLKMWNELTKPQEKRDAKLQDYFQIEVVAMPHLIYQKEDFRVKAVALKEQIIISLSRFRNGRIAASGFADYAKRIWYLIQEDKDLDLPTQRIIVAEMKCNQIAYAISTRFCKNEAWVQLKKMVYSKAPVNGFGKTVNLLVQNCLSQYDKEAQYFDETARGVRRKQLIQELLQVIEPIHWNVVECMRVHVPLTDFKKSVDLEEVYIKKGKDLQHANVIQDYIPHFRTQLHNYFADARIEYADWDHITTQCEIIENEAKSYLLREKESVLYKQEIMTAEIECKKIAAENYRDFCENEPWIQLKNDVYSAVSVKGFGKTVNSLVENCLSWYDWKGRVFNETVRNDKRVQLMDELLQVVQPVHLYLVELQSHVALEIFKKSINLEEDYIMKGKDFWGVNIIQDHIPAFSTELHNLFTDAYIKCTNWDHSTKLRETKEQEAKAFLEHEKDILLGKVKLVIAEEQCKKIAERNYTKFCENESWIQVKNDVCSKLIVEGFGDRVNSLIKNCIAEYDEKARNFDVTAVDERRKQLQDKLLQVVEPIHLSLVEHTTQVALENFKKSIDLETEFVQNREDLPNVLKDCVHKLLSEIHLHFEDASIVNAAWDHPVKLLEFNMEEAKAFVGTALKKLLVKLKRGDSKLLWKLAGSNVEADGHKFKNRVSTFFSQFNSFIVMWLKQKVNAGASAMHSGLSNIYRISLEKYATKRIHQEDQPREICEQEDQPLLNNMSVSH